MESIVSFIVSFLGLSQRSAQASSALRNEASKLNTEFEFTLAKTVQLLRSERLHLQHRIDAFGEEASVLESQVETVVQTLLAEVDIGLVTAANSRNTISTASAIAPSSKWDEVIMLLHQQKAAAELQLERSKLVTNGFHRVLDNAGSSDPQES